MSRAVEHGDFDKSVLADLLYQAKGPRSQRQFAEDCSMSATHLNRYFAQAKDSPPTPATLLRIAQNSNNTVSYESLLSASGYDPEKYINFQTGYADRGYMNEQEHKLSADQLRSLEISCIKQSLFDSSFKFEVICPEKAYPLEIIIEPETGPIDKWAFASFIDKVSAGTGARMREASSSLYSLFGAMAVSFPSECAKLSIVTNSQETYDALLRDDQPVKLNSYVSVILVDIDHFSVIDEGYLETELSVGDDIKELYYIKRDDQNAYFNRIWYGDE